VSYDTSRLFFQTLVRSTIQTLRWYWWKSYFVLCSNLGLETDSGFTWLSLFLPRKCRNNIPASRLATIYSSHIDLLSLRSPSLIIMSYRHIRSGVNEDSGVTGNDTVLLERTWCLRLLPSRSSGVHEESCTP
jgi:hypothetical protein